jgi:hypothetical protein
MVYSGHMGDSSFRAHSDRPRTVHSSSLTRLRRSSKEPYGGPWSTERTRRQIGLGLDSVRYCSSRIPAASIIPSSVPVLVRSRG